MSVNTKYWWLLFLLWPCIKWLIAQVAIGQHWNMMSAMLFFMEFVDITLEVCNLLRYEKAGGYMKKQLFGSFFLNMTHFAH
jgi:hypothetical protein